MSKSSRPNLYILVAMPYFSPDMRTVLEKVGNDIPLKFIIDSGAFTAHTSGMKITLEDHLTFLDTIQDFDHIAIQLDVMFNAEATTKNFYESLDRGYDVCPVFTRGEERSYLEKLVKEDHLIFMGALAGGSIEEYFDRALPVIKNGNDRFHLLGHTKPSVIKKWKPTSVDASSWSSCMRFGAGVVYNRGRLKTFSRKDFINKPKLELVKMIMELGFTMKEIQKLSKEVAWRNHAKYKGTPDWHFASFVSTCSHIIYCMMSEKMIGTKVYLAVGTPTHMEHIALCYEFLLKNGKLNKFMKKGK